MNLGSAWRTLLAMALITGGIVAYISNEHEIKRQRAAVAASGFSNYGEMQKAGAAGIKDPVAWEENKQKDAQIAARDAEMAAKARQTLQEQADKAAAYVREANRNPADRMTALLVSWQKGGFGSIGLVTVAIDNANDFTVRDIGITCTFTGNSGTKISEITHVIYDTVKAKSKRTFKDVNIGFINSQSSRAGCSVDTAKR